MRVQIHTSPPPPGRLTPPPLVHYASPLGVRCLARLDNPLQSKHTPPPRSPVGAVVPPPRPAHTTKKKKRRLQSRDGLPLAGCLAAGSKAGRGGALLSSAVPVSTVLGVVPGCLLLVLLLLLRADDASPLRYVSVSCLFLPCLFGPSGGLASRQTPTGSAAEARPPQRT